MIRKLGECYRFNRIVEKVLYFIRAGINIKHISSSRVNKYITVHSITITGLTEPHHRGLLVRSDGSRGVVTASTARHVAGAASSLLSSGLSSPPHSPPPACQLGTPVGGWDPLQGTAEVSRQPRELVRVGMIMRD